MTIYIEIPSVTFTCPASPLQVHEALFKGASEPTRATLCFAPVPGTRSHSNSLNVSR